ncbi:MAG TPA: nucleotidyltransferase family protein [Caulobacteraceae bacterium]|jgi:CTP:molybdopterin cytidylyltransferase MocA|nr:nucleotidyltransferase family protein [Caulobacteraceae bacterium]
MAVPTRISGLLLAAGLGKRLGGGKLAETHQDRTLAQWSLAPLQAVGLDAVVIVTGPGDAPRLFPDAEAVTVVENRNPEDGLASSLRLGLEAQPPASLAVLIALADMPLVKAQTLQTLIEAWRPDCAAVVPIWKAMRGNPVLADLRWAVRIADQLAGDQGLGAALNGLEDGLIKVEVDDRGVLFDVDTPDDLKLWRSR